MTVRIAVAQLNVKPGQVEDNRTRALALTHRALEGGADIVLLPEEMLIGYVPNLRDLAEPADGPTTAAFAEMLAGSESQVMWGATERNGELRHASAVLVGAEGVRAIYRKTHLWWADEGVRNETGHYAPGNELVTFDVKGHKAGVMICYDGDFPEMTRSYANLDCTMLFWMNNRGSRGHEEVVYLADRNSMIIASACCCGTDEIGRTCRGGSNVTGMVGNLISEIWDDEGVIFADVEPGDVLAQRRKNPWYRGRRPDLYV